MEPKEQNFGGEIKNVKIKKVSIFHKKYKWGSFLGGKKNEWQYLKPENKRKMGSLDLGVKKMKGLGWFSGERFDL